jgi:AraC-like DNA-binding protein
MFSLRLQEPTTELQEFVQFYTQREFNCCDSLVVHAVPARGAPMLEFVFGDRFKVRYTNSTIEETVPDSVVVGLQTRPLGTLHLQGTLQEFVIMFHVNGLTDLFKIPPVELTDHFRDADSVLGTAARELRYRLGACETFQQRVRVADAILSARLSTVSHRDVVGLAADHIVASDGLVQTAALANFAGLGERQFRRVFAAHFGCRPKQYARIVRFQAALDMKARSAKSWTEVAHELGYYDHMHMVHDFREFAVETPSETLSHMQQIFRAQIESIRLGSITHSPTRVRRFII